jgi:hypothetical protein
MNNSNSAPKFEAPCRHLRSKEMYYQPLSQQDDEFSSGLYWCNKTQESFGPDGDCVSKEKCCAARACFSG